jgi:hypothetical protein
MNKFGIGIITYDMLIENNLSDSCLPPGFELSDAGKLNLTNSALEIVVRKVVSDKLYQSY